MIDEHRLPDAWSHHTYVNGENFYRRFEASASGLDPEAVHTDQDNLVEIGVSDDGVFRVYNTSGHPESPQATQVPRTEFDDEAVAEDAFIDWMENNAPPAPQS